MNSSMKSRRFRMAKKVDLTSIDPFGDSYKPSLWKRIVSYILYVIGTSLMLGIANSLSCSGSRREPSIGERLIQNSHIEHSGRGVTNGKVVFDK